MKLIIHNIGNIEHYESEFVSDAITLIRGNNGAGKTTILRSIMFVVCGYSVSGHKGSKKYYAEIHENGYIYRRENGKDKLTVTDPSGNKCYSDSAEAILKDHFGSNISYFFLDNPSLTKFINHKPGERYKQILQIYDIEKYDEYLADVKAKKDYIGSEMTKKEDKVKTTKGSMFTPQVKRFSEEELRHYMGSSSFEEFKPMYERAKLLKGKLEDYSDTEDASDITPEDIEEARIYSELLRERNTLDLTPLNFDYEEIEVDDPQRAMEEYISYRTLHSQYGKEDHESVRYATKDLLDRVKKYARKQELLSKIKHCRSLEKIEYDISQKKIEIEHTRYHKDYVLAKERLEKYIPYTSNDLERAKKTRDFRKLEKELASLGSCPSDEDIKQDEEQERKYAEYLELRKKHEHNDSIKKQIESLPESVDDAEIKRYEEANSGRFMKCPSCGDHLILIGTALKPGAEYPQSEIKKHLDHLKKIKKDVEKRKKLETQLHKLDPLIEVQQNIFTSEDRKRYRKINEKRRNIQEQMSKYTHDFLDADPKEIENMIEARKSDLLSIEFIEKTGYPFEYDLVEKSLEELEQERETWIQNQTYLNSINELGEIEEPEYDNPETIENDLKKKEKYDSILSQLSAIQKITEKEYNYLANRDTIDRYLRDSKANERIENELKKLRSKYRKEDPYNLQKKYDDERKKQKILSELSSLPDIEESIYRDIEAFISNIEAFETYDRNCETIRNLEIEIADMAIQQKACVILHTHILRKKAEKINCSIEGLNTLIRQNMNNLLDDSVQYSLSTNSKVTGGKIETVEQGKELHIVASKDNRPQHIKLFSQGEQSCMYTAYMMSLYVILNSKIFISDENLSVLDERNKSIMFSKINELNGWKFIVSHGSPEENAVVLDI